MGIDMVGCMAGVSAVGRARKITITLPGDLIAILDSMKEQEKTTTSGVVANLLRRARQAEIEAEMAEGYKAVAEEGRRDVEACLVAQSEVVLRNDS